MAFVLANPPSPSARTRPLPERDHDAEWALSSPFRAVPFHSSSATTTTPSSSSSAAFPSDTTAHHPHVMSKEKDRQRLEISLDTDCLYLKGTGADVEPALLSGHVILHLAESTSIKEITLQFRGKARLPVSPSESISLNNSPNSFLLCHHQWSFLEGEKKHSHRLKAGRHIFPFQLQIGGSLPSSISTQASGGAAIIYKLRANLVRPGFSFAHSALQAVIPIYVVRAFSSEALEYQQTLEIENTWPEKLMYSIMLPHKAWAAGDKVVALAKFSPLAKGIRIISITSTVHETTKIYSAKGVYQESTHPVASVMHEMVGGVAHEVTRDELRRRRSASFGRSPSGAASPAGHGTRTPPQSHTPTPSTSSSAPMFSMTPLADPSSSSSSSSAHSSPRPAMLPLASTSTSTYTPSINPDETIETMDEMSTLLHIPIPPNTTTPTHSLDPIVVSHRLRWSILIHNLDGHTSELRCSLPIHVLDPRLLGEARQFTAVTRRFLLGDHHHHQHDYDDGYGGGGETMNDEDAELLMDNEEDLELPSYYSHVRDRVANMFLPEGATMRVTNPWVLHGVSPVIANNPTANTTITNGYGTTVHGGRSGYASPSPYGYDTPHRVNTLGGASVGVPSPLSQLPSAPRAGETTPLDWVNSELLLSLSNPSNASTTAANQVVSTSAPVPRNAAQPQGFGSRFSTRPNTRPPSPERERGDRLQASSRSSSFTNLVGALGHLSLISHAHGNNNQVHAGQGGENSNSESNSNSNSTTNLPATAPSNSNPPSHSHSHSNSNSNLPSSNPPAAANATSTAPAPASNPNPTAFTPNTTTTSNPNETYIHSSSSTRQTPSLTSISMKALAHHSWLPSRSGSFTNLSGLGGGAGGGTYGGGGVVNGTGDVGHTHMSLPFRHGQGQGQIPYGSSHPSLLSMAMTPSSTVTPPTAGSATPPLSLPHSQSQHTHAPISSIPLPDPELGSVLLHRAFTEVPDYSVASRGFLGGVPPLSSMQGLPSYEEAAASASTAGTGATRDDGEDGEGGSSSSSS